MMMMVDRKVFCTLVVVVVDQRRSFIRLMFDCSGMSDFLADNLVLQVPPNRCVGCLGVVPQTIVS